MEYANVQNMKSSRSVNRQPGPEPSVRSLATRFHDDSNQSTVQLMALGQMNEANETIFRSYLRINPFIQTLPSKFLVPIKTKH